MFENFPRANALLSNAEQHIFPAGFAGAHPLRGPNADDFGVRFQPLSDAYDLTLRRRVHAAWQKIEKTNNRKLHEGVYAFVSGPRSVWHIEHTNRAKLTRV